MTTADTSPQTRTTSRRVLRFVGHYVEMVAVMIIGMVVLGMIWPAGWVARPDVGAVLMATDMTVAMVAWMAFRRHAWPRIAEMAAAMYLPFLALLAPYWLGLISGTTLMVAGHVIMFVLMLAAMLLRRNEYGH